MANQLHLERTRSAQVAHQRSVAEERVSTLAAEVAKLKAIQGRAEAKPQGSTPTRSPGGTYINSQGLTWTLDDAGRGIAVARVPTGVEVTSEADVSEAGLELEC